MSGIAAIILAAGRSTRFRAAGGTVPTKLVAEFRGEPLVRHVARAALATGLHPAIVVTGHARPEVETALAGFPVRFVHNPRFSEGIATSLQCGLAALPPEASGAIVLLGDMPLVGPVVLQALVDAFERSPEAEAAAPLWAGQRGNPVLLSRGLFAAVSRLSGDEGARRLLRDPALRVVDVPVADAAVTVDLDDPESLRRIS